MRQIHGQTTQREQMQSRDEAQRVNMERRAQSSLRSMVGWWGTGACSQTTVGIID
jgi:hypothetical protein